MFVYLFIGWETMSFTLGSKRKRGRVGAAFCVVFLKLGWGAQA